MNYTLDCNCFNIVQCDKPVVKSAAFVLISTTDVVECLIVASMFVVMATVASAAASVPDGEYLTLDCDVLTSTPTVVSEASSTDVDERDCV